MDDIEFSVGVVPSEETGRAVAIGITQGYWRFYGVLTDDVAAKLATSLTDTLTLVQLWRAGEANE